MNIVSKSLHTIYRWYISLLEKKIGYRVEFTDIPDTWINGMVKITMGPSWARHGIKALGVNHWTVGVCGRHNVSSRYDRDAVQYQSWLGAYLVRFKQHKNFTIQDHFNLAVADQKNWLRDLGDPDPYIEMPEAQVTNSSPIQCGTYQGVLHEFSGGPSHSDVGSYNHNLLGNIVMRISAFSYNSFHPQLNISHKHLIPVDIHSEYETVTLKGYAAIIPLEEDVYVVLYGNGTALLDNNRNEIKDYTPLLEKNILRAFHAVRINKL